MTLTKDQIMHTLGKISSLTSEASNDLRMSDNPVIKTSVRTEKPQEAKQKALESAQLLYWFVKEMGLVNSVEPFTREYVEANYEDIFPKEKDNP